jgi:hypothetical protein
MYWFDEPVRLLCISTDAHRQLVEGEEVSSRTNGSWLEDSRLRPTSVRYGTCLSVREVLFVDRPTSLTRVAVTAMHITVAQLTRFLPKTRFYL